MQRTHGMMIAAVGAAVALTLGGCDRLGSNQASTAATTASSSAPMTGSTSDNTAAPATGSTSDNSAALTTGSTSASGGAATTETTSDNTVAQATSPNSESSGAPMTGAMSDSSMAKPADNATDANGNVVAAVADDAAISARITRSILDDPLLKSSQINVGAKAGTVTLTGMVDTSDLRARAHQIATMTPGVAGVVDNLAVKNHG